MTDYAQSALPK